MPRNKTMVRLAGPLILVLTLVVTGCETSTEAPMGPEVGLQLDVAIGVPASAFTGAEQCRLPYGGRQCVARPFDTTQDLAFQGNGFASAAVARDVIAGYSPIHRPEYANDGFYGNGASWISGSAGSWVKIDLGRTVAIERMIFGRDRARNYNDRDPGQFTIEVASSDDVYANGSDGNDAAEYSQVIDSYADGFSGSVGVAETVEATFAPVLARFVKLTFAAGGAAIDEIEVFGDIIDVTASLLPVSAKSVKHNKGRFEVAYSCEGWTVSSALLNGIPVVDGQIVDLRLNQGKSERSKKSDKSKKSGKSGRSTKIHGTSFTLVVTCADETATATAEFPAKSAKSDKSNKSNKSNKSGKSGKSKKG